MDRCEIDGHTYEKNVVDLPRMRENRLRKLVK